MTCLLFFVSASSPLISLSLSVLASNRSTSRRHHHRRWAPAAQDFLAPPSDRAGASTPSSSSDSSLAPRQAPPPKLRRRLPQSLSPSSSSVPGKDGAPSSASPLQRAGARPMPPRLPNPNGHQIRPSPMHTRRFPSTPSPEPPRRLRRPEPVTVAFLQNEKSSSPTPLDRWTAPTCAWAASSSPVDRGPVPTSTDLGLWPMVSSTRAPVQCGLASVLARFVFFP
mgnify:CR=1 FL=1